MFKQWAQRRALRQSAMELAEMGYSSEDIKDKLIEEAGGAQAINPEVLAMILEIVKLILALKWKSSS